jgi:hypothetical protein
MSKTKLKAIEEIKIHASLKTAIEEQQSRVWRLRNLIECVRQAADSSEDIEDFGAAISGLQDYADDIHMTLDAGEIGKRATSIEEERRGAGMRAAIEAACSTDVEDVLTRQ